MPVAQQGADVGHLVGLWVFSTFLIWILEGEMALELLK